MLYASGSVMYPARAEAATVAALKKYQADNGLKDDALDGPKTWALLNKKL